MTLFEAPVAVALIAGSVAYLLPLILWSRLRSNFPLELFSVPALAQASWLAAEYFNLGPEKVGFTFLGAIAVAVASDVVVALLARVKGRMRRNRLWWRFGIVVVSVVMGLGLRILLPALPE
jgi:hypothetical protein